MIKFISAICIFIAFLTPQAKGQKTFHVVIQIPSSSDVKDFSITYDDGLGIKTVTDTFVNSKLTFSGKFYSKFSVLKISHQYGSDVYYDQYFIGSQPAEIIFSSDSSFSEDGKFHASKLKNATEIFQSNIAKQRNEFSKESLVEMNHFVERNNESIWQSDSLKKLFFEKLKNINKSDIQFIKKNADNYYSFWWFRTQVIPNTFINKNASVTDFDNLLTVYNMAFRDSYKESLEGQRTKNLLTGSITTRLNKGAPDFESKDINGKSIRLQDFQGKYVLLDFWATWCGPCMAQLPFIKKIRKDYPANKLAIIGISEDVDYKNFDAVINKNNMDWIHVFGNTDLGPMYGVDAIPAVILIDQNGTIIFRDKGDNTDELIDLLNKM